MSPEELRLTPLRPIDALTLGALDYLAGDVDAASRPMRYAAIRRWVLTVCMRPQVSAFLITRAGAVVGACSLTSHEHGYRVVEVHLAGPEAHPHSEVVTAVLSQLEVIANAHGSRLLSLRTSSNATNHVRAPATCGLFESLQQGQVAVGC